MDWNFPKPEEDAWYRRAYDAKYGKGAFERDFGLRGDTHQTSEASPSPTGSSPHEFRLKRKFFWDYDNTVGVVEKNGKFSGVACLVAKKVKDGESFVKRFGLDFKRDVHWRGISKLLEHLAREEQFKAVLVTTNKMPFQLLPDVPGKVEGRVRWVNRNLEYHKDVFDSVNKDVKAAREFGMFPVSKELLEREKVEALNVGRFLDQQRADDSQVQSHVKPFREMKDKVFAASLFFYIYTSAFGTREEAFGEIIKKKTATKIEITQGYFITCDDVQDPKIVFTGFLPTEEIWKTYGSLALAEEAAGFNPDRDVAIALQKMVGMSLQVPPEGVRFEEKNHCPRRTPIRPNS